MFSFQFISPINKLHGEEKMSKEIKTPERLVAYKTTYYQTDTFWLDAFMSSIQTL